MSMTTGILRASQTEKDGLVWCLVTQGCDHTSPTVQTSGVLLRQISRSSLCFGLGCGAAFWAHKMDSFRMKLNVKMCSNCSKAPWPWGKPTMHRAEPNLPHQLLLHRAAPTTSQYLLVQTCLCQHHIPAPWQICLLHTWSHLHPLIASFISECILLREAGKAERQTISPAIQQHRHFETDSRIDSARRE